MKVRLGDVCTFQSGGTPRKSEPSYFGGNIPWVTTVALNNSTIDQSNAVEWITEKAIKESAAKIVPANSILVGTRVGVGKVSMNTVPISTSQDIIALLNIDDNKWEKAYLREFILSKKDYFQSQARGATIKGIKIETLAELDLPEISLSEQKHAANTIRTVSQLISLRKLQQIKLGELVKSQFIEMFGDLGTDEKGWGLSRLGKCCVINPRKSDDSRISNELDVSFVAMPSVSEDGEIDTSIIRPYIEVKNGFTYFAENDVLFAKITPCMENGKVAIARNLHNELGFGSTEFHVLRPIPDKVIPEWIFAITKFPQFRKDAEKQMTGTGGQKRVPAAFLENYPISIPPIDQQNQFAVFMRQTDKSKFAIQKSLETLESLKNALMQHYFG